MELSIIVPVYNVEKYLSKCIESILSQTFTDFELILIDDGSPDNCGKIIDSYAEKDSRIVAIHQKNKGVSAARNAGLRIAKGKYIGFVDPDDYISEEMYMKMMKSAELNEADVVCCGFYHIDECGESVCHKMDLSTNMKNEEFLIHIFDIPRTVCGTLWNKIFRRTIIDNNFCEDYDIAEDWLFVISNSINAKNVSIVNEAFYFYFSRIGNTTYRIARKNVKQLEVKLKSMEFLESFGREVICAAEADFLNLCISVFDQIDVDNDADRFKQVSSIYCKYVKKNCMRILLNTKIYYKTRIMYFIKYLKVK